MSAQAFSYAVSVAVDQSLLVVVVVVHADVAAAAA